MPTFQVVRSRRNIFSPVRVPLPEFVWKVDMLLQVERMGLERILRRTLLLFVGAVMAILATMQAVGQTSAATSRQQPAAIVPMAADAHPSFAVATIKPHDPDSNRQGFYAVGDRFYVHDQSITGLMMFAYSLDKHQIAGLPEWTGTAR
jgi:hypothetical protein